MEFVLESTVAMATIYATIALVYVREYVEWETKSIVQAVMRIVGYPAIGYTLTFVALG
ncbi:hypothetical protein [Halostella salina]|uniref:hypothetical protein n=1 Tax=Halostella salina TaxID=1547897 RepID=UPI0013CE5FAD|nr:hypothetical protein [Halostella salina]